MWSTIIQILEKAWKEKPRRDLARGFVTLRCRMTDCQRRYEKYSSNINSDILREEWYLSISLLAVALGEMHVVLNIFAPASWRSLYDFLCQEKALEYEDRFGPAILVKMGEDLGGSPGFDLSLRSMEPEFLAALQHLDAFLKENFKPDELYALSKEQYGKGWHHWNK
jgi:hypothetical protein